MWWASPQASVIIWDANTGHELHAPLKIHTSRVYCLQWTADGKTLVSGPYDGLIRTWIHTTTWQQTAVLNEHNEGIHALASSSNSRILASASFRSAPPACMGTELRVVGKVLATGCEDSKAAAYMWNISAIIREAGPVDEDTNVS